MEESNATPQTLVDGLMTLSLALVRPEPDLDDDEDRYRSLYRAYQPRLRRLAASRFPGQDSEDIAQEAMLRVLQHLDRLDPMRDPWPYLAAICVNIGRDMAERSSRLSRCRDSEGSWPAAPPADEGVLAAVGERWVHQVLSSLPALPRTALTLQVLEQMSIPEIAALLGRTDNAIRQLLFRARREARLLIGEANPPPANLATRPSAVAPVGP